MLVIVCVYEAMSSEISSAVGIDVLTGRGPNVFVSSDDLGVVGEFVSLTEVATDVSILEDPEDPAAVENLLASENMIERSPL